MTTIFGLSILVLIIILLLIYVDKLEKEIVEKTSQISLLVRKGYELARQIKAQEPIEIITYPDPEQEARIQKTAELSKARKAKKAS